MFTLPSILGSISAQARNKSGLLLAQIQAGSAVPKLQVTELRGRAGVVLRI